MQDALEVFVGKVDAITNLFVVPVGVVAAAAAAVLAVVCSCGRRSGAGGPGVAAVGDDVEGEQDDGLERGDLEVERLGRCASLGVERPFDGGVAEGVHPRQPSLGIFFVVVRLEDLGAGDDVAGEPGVNGRKRRPVARGEDLDGEVRQGGRVGGPPLEERRQRAVEVLLVVDPDREVVEHALHLAGKLRPAPELELADHEALSVVRGGPLVQEALRELVPIDLREEVLVGEVGKQLDRLLQVGFDVLFRELLAAGFEEPVAEGRHEFGVRKLADVLVDELHKGFLEGLLEEGVSGELARDDVEVLVVQRQQFLHEGRILVGVLLLARLELGFAPRDNVVAHRLHVGLDEGRHRREAVRHPREEAIHPRQVGGAIVGQQGAAPRPVFFEEGRLPEFENLELADAEELGFGRRIEIRRDSRLLVVQRPFRLLQVAGRIVRFDPLLRLAFVVVLRGVEHRIFEVGHVRVEGSHPHRLQELDALLHQPAINDGPVPLSVDEGDHRRHHVLLYFAVHERLKVLKPRDV
mmetsp:Transcript_24746/g.80018  ORF Transcript_24746/g.80018 Transcript_24746/m.80018 type:complete len:523 (+) Transcript_24746:749-2317(+)